jgi:hypothetical protein
MPKLRLSEVIAENSIDVDALSLDIREAITRVLVRENTLDKLNAEIAKDLRAIADSLNVSIFDLLTPAEKFYRLKIFENLTEPEYSGSQKEKLEKLFAKLPSYSKISFTLLALYATQVLPESILKGSDLKQVCKVLGISVENLKEISTEPNQTISVESILISLGISLDELSMLLEIPKKFIPWISKEPKIVNVLEQERRFRIPRIDDRAFLFRGVEERGEFFITEELTESDMCNLFPIFCHIQ